MKNVTPLPADVKKIIVALIVFALAYGATWLIEIETVAQWTRTVLIWVSIGFVLVLGYFVIKVIE